MEGRIITALSERIAAVTAENQKLLAQTQVVFVSRHGERLDYECKKQGINWQQTSARPWDSPLSPAGHQQAEAMGRACASHAARLGLAPPTKIITSPLIRCAETAAGAAKG
jgi:broad specificity phosphatase PhoE